MRLQTLRHYWQQEGARLLLWVPVLFGAGIASYFAMEGEPSVLAFTFWPAVVGLALFSLLRNRRYALLWVALAIAFSGLAWAKIYSDSHGTQMLKKATRITDVAGQVTAVEIIPGGQRIVLESLNIPVLDDVPDSVRLNIRSKKQAPLHVGDWVELRAGLMPPSGPVMENGFDFARFFYFRGIGAVGYGLPPVNVTEHAELSGWRIAVNEMRGNIAATLREEMGPEKGAVAAALMTGERAAIPDDVTEAMRVTNLSHILAISGMHMALITGLVFITLRVGLVWFPPTQHHPHIKKIAAAAGLAAGAAYLVLSGFPISAVRAFVMVALLLGAVLLDREVLPMRSLAWAALLLLCYNPTYLLEPGFQLSFAATMGLIAWYEAVRAKREEQEETPSFRKRAILYLGAILMTTLIAELVTTPLVLYHFNNASFYGMLANLIVMPIVAFIIMPCIVLAALLWATPLLPYILDVMGYGIEAMIVVAQTVSELPHAQQFLPSPPAWSVALGVLGLCWICIMRGQWRYYGLAPVAITLLTIPFFRAPDFFIAPDRGQIALRIDGELQMVKGTGKSFASQQWANGVGEISFTKYAGEKECDDVGCVYEAAGKRIGVYQDYKIVPKDYCPDVDIAIATFYWNAACDPDWLIDRNDSDDHGGLWGWYDGTLSGTDDEDGSRPWSNFSR